MPRICLVVNLSKHGASIREVRYPAVTCETMQEAEKHCKELNDQLLNARYRVVEDE